MNYLARQEPPKLILLDVMMPGVDGLSALRAIRRELALAGVPVVMYTALSEPDVRREAEQLGVQGYIVKGRMAFHEIYDQVRRYVE